MPINPFMLLSRHLHMKLRLFEPFNLNEISATRAIRLSIMRICNDPYKHVANYLAGRGASQMLGKEQISPKKVRAWQLTSTKQPPVSQY